MNSSTVWPLWQLEKACNVHTMFATSTLRDLGLVFSKILLLTKTEGGTDGRLSSAGTKMQRIIIVWMTG